MSSMPHHIFFYGSLMKGMGGQEYLQVQEDLAFVASASLPGALYDMGQYPALLPGRGVVYGEIYKMKELAVLDRLDRFEEYVPGDHGKSMYVRSVHDFGKRVAYVYVYNKKIHEQAIVPCGDWRKHCIEMGKMPEF